jgi:5-methylcytosine-specific restriction protein B
MLERLGGIPGRIQTVLERKSQVILYGPPGTGKTHWAEIAARELAARGWYAKEFEALSDQERVQITGPATDRPAAVQICTFHPAFGYEDFIEGFRPEKSEDQLVFVRRDGLLKQMASWARDYPDKPFYLIIDEVNRGDVPRIFGELLTILEKSKRGKVVRLSLSGEPFSVPPNLHLIGTMNTADRSIALLDTALRRRFGFIEMMPDSSVLGNAVVEGIPLGAWLDALNSRLREHIGRDARNLQIGHSYFMHGDAPITDPARFIHAIQDEIVPLLEEYCYEDYDTLERLLGADLVDRDRQMIRSELFRASRKNDLIQALLQPCPEIVASQRAVDTEAEVDLPEDEPEDAERDE